LALPAGAREKVLVCCKDLYCPKFALEDKMALERELQDEEVHEILTALVILIH